MDTNKCAECGRTMNLSGDKLCVWCRPVPVEPLKNLVSDRLGNDSDSDEQKAIIENWYRQQK